MTAPTLIDYFPDSERHARRSPNIRARSMKEGRMSLPDGFPAKIDSEMAWTGESLMEDEWLTRLSGAYLEEIKNALRHFQALDLSLSNISPETFPLPTLGPFIKETLAPNVYNGRGVVVLRGVAVDRYDKIQNAIVFAGLSSWLGPLRAKQDLASNVVLRHIIDLTSQGAVGTAQYTADLQPYHTDWGDVVALYCLETAVEGGASHLASVSRIYNELATDRPDIVRVLSGNWAFDSFDAENGSIDRPLLFYHQHRLILQYSRRLFTGFQTYKPNCPGLTEEQADAMEELEFVARKHALTFNMEKGDLLWFNNMGLLHARGEFQDSPQQIRELLRIWARNEELGWQMPPQLQAHWKQLYYSSDAESQIFFPEQSNGRNGAEMNGKGKAWLHAGNEGGIPS